MAKRNTYFQDEVIEKKIDVKQLGRTLRYIIPHRKVIILVGFLMFISSLVSLIPPLLVKRIINQTVISNGYKELILILTCIATLAVVEIGITFVHSRLMGKMGHSIIAKIREDIFYKLQELPFEYFDNRPDGKIVVRVTEYINGLANFFTNNVMMFVIYVVKVTVVTVIMLTQSPLLTAIVILTVIPMMACVLFLRYTIRKMFGSHRAKVSNRTAFLVESIMGEKIVKNYNRAEINKKIYAEVNDISIRQWWKIVLRNELNTPIVETFWNIGTMCIFGVSLYMILNGSAIVNAGLVVTFITYMGLFSGPITQIAFIIQNLAQVSSNLEQVFDTIDYPATIHDTNGSNTIRDVEGSVEFENVTFGYEEGVNVLENFNLQVEPGKTVALVGPTGAGKTTIINMLTRFYDVNEGSVKVDGMDVRDITLDSLRKEVGVLMQDPFIFKGTVIENIRYGRIDATDEECIEAAKTIFADRCIDKLKGGYYHVLDERGEGLSAGEKQLISFARIILKNPSIVILDEATSSIDTETENLIKKALDIILKEKTAFIVAHRLSTIRNADRILYIANKGIAEQGTHEELMEKHGLYYELNL